jgi:hypothetical protein
MTSEERRYNHTTFRLACNKALIGVHQCQENPVTPRTGPTRKQLNKLETDLEELIGWSNEQEVTA